MKGRGNQSFAGMAAQAAGCADGSRCPSAGRMLPLAEERSEVLVGIVKAGRMVWRGSFSERKRMRAWPAAIVPRRKEWAAGPERLSHGRRHAGRRGTQTLLI